MIGCRQYKICMGEMVEKCGIRFVSISMSEHRETGTGNAKQNGGMKMNSVQRARGIRRIIRRFALGEPVQKFVVAGRQACRKLMPESRSRRQPCPSDRAILAWAEYDLTWEIVSGFWDSRAA